MSKNGVDILLQDIEVPDIVQEKARNAFAQINMESKGENVKDNKNKKAHPFWRTKAAAVVVAAVVGGGSMTALAAACIHWSDGMKGKMHVTEEQMLELQNGEDTPLSFPSATDTQGNITISTAQCLLDENTVRVAFYVDGYELQEGEEPRLESLSILLDGEPANNYEWSFYTGIEWDENGNPMMADGSAVKETETEIIPNYKTADGRMEIDVIMSPVDGNGKAIKNLAGKEITVQMENFGETTGTWTLEWTLEGTGTVVEKELNGVLGNSGATVTKVSLSPMSVKVCYDFAMQEITETIIDENGKETEAVDYAEPPQFVGFKMTDGTVYTAITDGGTFGYEDMDSSLYVAEFGLSRIVNPEEVQSLLFLKDGTASGEQEITEEQCYVVDIK